MNTNMGFYYEVSCINLCILYRKASKHGHKMMIDTPQFLIHNINQSKVSLSKAL